MANFEIPEILEYIDRIRKLEPTDPAHADLFNAMFQALINNGAFLKKMQEKQAADAQEQTQQQYEQLTGYTDMKIGELINGAPETLDTIKEVADAILENETIVEALNEAVGKKLNKDGDLTDTTVTFTSEDDENPTTWTAMRKVVSGKLKDILGSVSIMAKNLNYLRKMLGTDDISMLGNGTLTGAVSKLNTDLQATAGIKYIDFGAYDGSKMALDDVVKEILNKFPLSLDGVYIGYFVMGPTYRIIIQPFRERTHSSAIVFSYATKGVVFYTKILSNIKKYTTVWDETTI